MKKKFKENPNDSKVTNGLISVYGLNDSTRYLCPNPNDSGDGGSYSIKHNFCHRCGYKANDVVKLMTGLIKYNPSNFKGFTPSPSQIEQNLKRNGIPLFFREVITKEQKESEEVRLKNSINGFLKSKEANRYQGVVSLSEAEFKSLSKDLDPNENYDFTDEFYPIDVYYQKTKYQSSLSFGNPEVGFGSYFSRGNYKDPTRIKMVENASSVVESKISDKTYMIATPGWLNKKAKDALKSGNIDAIQVDNEDQFYGLLGFLVSESLPMPKISILKGQNNLDAKTSEELGSYFIKTKKRPPDGVNYQNIDDPKDFDAVIELGDFFVEISPEISKEKRTLVKTGAITVAELILGDDHIHESVFTANGSEIGKAVDLLKFKTQTPNIVKEIEMLESLSPKQIESFDLQLKIAKAIKKMFPSEFFGVKGSANNLNILYSMGITLIDPSEDDMLSPYTFLDPKTNKNPDIDFELSPEQIAKFTEKYPELTRGLSVTVAGDRVHVCKFFLNLPEDMQVYQSGKYIPIDSKKIEKTQATPIDLISSQVVTRVNRLLSEKDAKIGDVPDSYKVKAGNIVSENLPHFNQAVGNHMDRTGIKETDMLSTDDMSNLCALNRPIFYFSMVVLEDEKKNKFNFSYTGKKGSEALYPMSYGAEKILENIPQEEITDLNYKKESLGPYNIAFMRSNYLVSPPRWVVSNSDEILDSTNGVILYQDQLIHLLDKYTDLTPEEVNLVIKKISHPAKSEDDEKINIKMKKGTPSGIINQIMFITSSQNAFFFKKGHAQYLAETARRLSYLQSNGDNGNEKAKDKKPTQKSARCQ